MKADFPGMEVDILFRRDEGRSEHMYTIIFVYFHMKFNIRTWILRVEAYFLGWIRWPHWTSYNLSPHVEDWAEWARKPQNNKDKQE